MELTWQGTYMKSLEAPTIVALLAKLVADPQLAESIGAPPLVPQMDVAPA